MKAMGDLLKFILILSVFLSIVNGGKLDGTCPTGMHCLKFPPTCGTDNCEATASVEKKPDDVFSFVYQRADLETTPSAFLALGISKDMMMGDDLAVICFKNGKDATIRTFKNNDHIPPTVEDPTPSGLFVADPKPIVDKDGVLRCSFEIKFPIKFKGLEDFPVDGPTYILMSFGDTDAANTHLPNPAGHGGNRVAGTEPFMGTAVPPPPAPPGTGGTGTGGTDTGEKIKQAFSGPCPTGMQCLKLPLGCTDKDCKGKAVVEKKADNVFSFVYQREVDSPSPSAYLALAISKDKKMDSDFAVICFKDAAGANTKIRTFRNQDHTTPTLVEDAKTKDLLVDPKHSLEDGILKCSFEIKFPFTFQELKFRVGEPTFVLMASGHASDDALPRPHLGTDRTVGEKDLMEGIMPDPEPDQNTGATERVSFHQIWTCGVFVCLGLFIIPFIYFRQ